MHSKKKILSTLLFIFILIPTTSIIAADYSPNLSKSEEKADWTVMFYFAADNKIGKESEFFIENLSKIGSSNNVNFVILYDGDKKNDSKLYFVKIGGGLEDISNIHGWPDEVNTGNVNTLRLFCKQTMEDYPAYHYSLCIVTLGSGWQGFSPDFQDYPEFPLISIPDFADVLKGISNDGQNKIDIVSIVACLMGMVEDASEIRPYANYFIASEADNANLCIWPSIEVLASLKNGTIKEPEDFAKQTIGSYSPEKVFLGSERIRKIFDRLPFQKFRFSTVLTCLSLINLSTISKLDQHMNDLTEILLLNQNNKSLMATIKDCRKESIEFGNWSPKNHMLYKPKICPLYDNLPLEIFAFDCYIDLYNFVENLKNNTSNVEIKNICEKIMDTINETVTSFKSTSKELNSHGLSIYFPENRKDYGKGLYPIKIPCPYSNLLFSKITKWNEFLGIYLNIK